MFEQQGQLEMTEWLSSWKQSESNVKNNLAGGFCLQSKLLSQNSTQAKQDNVSLGGGCQAAFLGGFEHNGFCEMNTKGPEKLWQLVSSLLFPSALSNKVLMWPWIRRHIFPESLCSKHFSNKH